MDHQRASAAHRGARERGRAVATSAVPAAPATVTPLARDARGGDPQIYELRGGHRAPRSSHRHPRRCRPRACRNLLRPTPARPILHTDTDGTAHLHDTRNLRFALHLLIKAICDWDDEQKAKNKKVRQRRAAQSAAEFLLHTLQQVSLVPIRTRTRRRSPARYNA